MDKREYYEAYGVLTDKADKILQALDKNNGYCPCLGKSDNPDNICPCKVYREHGKCRCGLYERK